MKHSRLFQYDLIRVIAMVFVIGVHLPFDFTENPWLVSAKGAIFLLGNAMFYMLSGKFNLTEKAYISIPKFYKKKAVNILFPFFLWSLLIYFYNIRHSYQAMSVGEIGKGFLDAVLVTNPSTHLWFMYPLVGFLISAPFLAKLLDALSEKEIWILVTVGLVWSLVQIILIYDITLGYSPFSGWFLDSWCFYFAMGACIDRLHDTIMKKKLFYIGIGLLCLLMTTLWKIYLPDRSAYIYDLSPVYMLASVGIYLLILCIPESNNSRIKKVISFIARHSFGVYAIHTIVIEQVKWKLYFLTGFKGYIMKYIIVLGVSLSCSWLVDLIVIEPVKSLLNRNTDTAKIQ